MLHVQEGRLWHCMCFVFGDHFSSSIMNKSVIAVVREVGVIPFDPLNKALGD